MFYTSGLKAASAIAAIMWLTYTVPSRSQTMDSPEIKELYEKAKEEGQVVLYSTTPQDNITQLVDAFTERYPGVVLDASRLNATGLLQRFSTEKDAGARTADVITHPEELFQVDATKKGWLTPIDGTLLGEFPKQDIHPELGPIVAQHLTLISYNTKLVTKDEVPTEWAQLADPKWKGKMLFLDPREYQYVPRVIGQLVDSGLGDDWVRALAAQDLRFPTGGAVPGTELLGAGEAAIFPLNNGLVVRGAMGRGAPVDYVIPSPQIGPLTLVGLNAKPEHPNAAKLLVHFMLSREGSAAIYKGDEKVIVTPYEKPEGVKFILPDLSYLQDDQKKRIYGLFGL